MRRIEAYRIHPYRSLLPVVESMSVMHIAEPSLEYVDPGASAASVRRWMLKRTFDAAPVEGVRSLRFVALEDVRGRRPR